MAKCCFIFTVNSLIVSLALSNISLTLKPIFYTSSTELISCACSCIVRNIFPKTFSISIFIVVLVSCL